MALPRWGWGEEGESWGLPRKRASNVTACRQHLALDRCAASLHWVLTVWSAYPRVCEAQQRADAPGAVHQRLALVLRDCFVYALGLGGQQLHVVNNVADAAVACNNVLG